MLFKFRIVIILLTLCAHTHIEVNFNFSNFMKIRTCIGFYCKHENMSFELVSVNSETLVLFIYCF